MFVYYILVTILWFSRGDFGRLGHGDPSDLFVPHPIRALQGLRIKQIACGDCHCLAVTTESKVLRCVFLCCTYFNLFLICLFKYVFSRVVNCNSRSLYFLLLKLGAESKWWTWTWYHKGLSRATKNSSIWGTFFIRAESGLSIMITTLNSN